MFFFCLVSGAYKILLQFFFNSVKCFNYIHLWQFMTHKVCREVFILIIYLWTKQFLCCFIYKTNVESADVLFYIVRDFWWWHTTNKYILYSSKLYYKINIFLMSGVFCIFFIMLMISYLPSEMLSFHSINISEKNQELPNWPLSLICNILQVTVRHKLNCKLWSLC